MHCTFGNLAIEEQSFIYREKLIRPFSSTYQLHSKCYSTLLQRVIVDFASDESFEKAHRKLKEHYNLTIPESSIRSITLDHAQKIKEQKKEIQKLVSKKPIIPYIVSEADGTMVPIVVPDSNASDKRKVKKLIFREARLSLAYEQGTIHPTYEASFGEPNKIGEQIAYCAEIAGRKPHSKIHFVGDGATWIAEQVEKQFGSDATYLIDFYHMTQYLADASQCCSPLDKDSWRTSMQELMKKGKVMNVLKELQSHIDEAADDHECPAEKCYNYFVKRLNQFDYKGALEQELPIGSGKIESGHRNVIQKRLKVPGAWWLEENADAMFSLRVIRENGFWDNYWPNIAGDPN